MFTPDELFQSIMRPEICNLILLERNQKGKRVCDAFNNDLMNKFPLASGRLPSQTFEPFTEAELLAFIGILIAASVHRQNKENLDDMWKGDALPLIRAAMSRDRFKMMLRFIKFDNENTRAERAQTDKTAPVRDIWIMLNRSLEKAYKPYECIIINEQLFPFRGYTKFTQYMPSKPATYGIKVFWACDASNEYPALQYQIYTGKPIGGPRQVNVGERTLLNLVSLYKSSRRNVTTDNFSQLWNYCSLGIDFLKNGFSWYSQKTQKISAKQHAAYQERPVYSTNFAYDRDVTVCSYVPKKKKAVVLLSSMHVSREVEETQSAKPKIVKYYSKTKGGVDTMDKMLKEYIVKRRTLRWPLAFFYNMVDVPGLACYAIYREHNERFRAKHQTKKVSERACQCAVYALD